MDPPGFSVQMSMIYDSKGEREKEELGPTMGKRVGERGRSGDHHSAVHLKHYWSVFLMCRLKHNIHFYIYSDSLLCVL